MTAGKSTNLSTFGKLPCAQCGVGLIAPVWSEHVNERQVRHLWSCDDCRYEFETLVFFQSAEQPDAVRRLIAA